MVASDWLPSQSSFSLSSGEFQKGDNNRYHCLSSLSQVFHCPMEIKRWLIPLTAFVVLRKSWHKVEDTAYLPVGAKAHNGSLIMKTEDTTSAKNWKNVCKEIGTRLSAGIQDIHRSRNEQEVCVHLWACVPEERECELEALEGCLSDLGEAGYTTWIRKNRWLTLPVKIGKFSSSGVLAEVLPSMKLPKKGQSIQIASYPKGVKEAPAGGSLSGVHQPLWPKPCGGLGRCVPLSEGSD